MRLDWTAFAYGVTFGAAVASTGWLILVQHSWEKGFRDALIAIAKRRGRLESTTTDDWRAA